MGSSSLLQRSRSVTSSIDDFLAADEVAPGRRAIAPELCYPNQIWFNLEPTENIKCYANARNDISRLPNVNPGSIGGKPIEEPYTCENVLDGSLKDGLKKPIEQAADGCSVTCPEDHHAVFVLVGDLKGTYYVAEIQPDGSLLQKYPDVHTTQKTGFHFVRQDQDGRFSQKLGPGEPTNLDGAGDEFSCPPRASHVYNDTKLEPAKGLGPHDVIVIIHVQDYHTLCGFLCASTIPDYPGYQNPVISDKGKHSDTGPSPNVILDQRLPPSLPLKQKSLPAAELEQAMRSSNASSYNPSERARSLASSSRGASRTEG